MKLILYTVTIISTFFSCKTQKNVNDSSTSSNQVMQRKITIQDLEKSAPIVIKTDKGNEEVYPVIIYTKDSKELIKNNIIIQSISENFVTAMIRKNELDKIYKLKSVQSIELPLNDTIH